MSRVVAERLALVNRQLDHARQELDRLVRQLAEAAPADCPDAAAEDDPDSSTQQPDAAILLSMPGIGTGVLAALLAEAGDAVQRRDYDALRCICGVAPVTAYFGGSGSPVSAEVDHLFRSKWITDFGGSGSLSAEVDHPVSGVVSAHR